MNQIEELRRQGLSVCGIADVTGFDRKTVRKYLANPERQPRYGPRQKRPSQLDAFKPYIDERLAAGVWNAVVLMRELRERGYAGGVQHGEGVSAAEARGVTGSSGAALRDTTRQASSGGLGPPWHAADRWPGIQIVGLHVHARL